MRTVSSPSTFSTGPSRDMTGEEGPDVPESAARNGCVVSPSIVGARNWGESS
jgi:hypothetical protein